ncbi:MAG: hypothetical protein WCP81_11350, partial [Actinomycetes bacterium]
MISADAYDVATSDAFPVIVITDDASIVPLVAASISFRSLAATLPADSVTSAAPRPIISEDAYAVATSNAVPVNVITD